jgi:hypothetical protein
MAIGGVLMFFVSSRIRGQFAQVAIASAGSVASLRSSFFVQCNGERFSEHSQTVLGYVFRFAVAAVSLVGVCVFLGYCSRDWKC